MSFDVERIGPTRIYPPVSYEMRMIVKANQDFAGEIIETVPASFEIIGHETRNLKTETQDENVLGFTFHVLSADNNKELVWSNVNLQEGDIIEIVYTFDAPNISPYLYLLGPLSFQEFQVSSFKFQEARQWQIASDDPGEVVIFLTIGTGWNVPDD